MSLNSIFTLSEKTKLKAIFFLTGNKQTFFRETEQIFSGNQTDFVNREEFTLTKQNVIGFSKIDLNSNISGSQNLKLESKFSAKSLSDKNSLVFNSLDLVENLDSDNTLLDQKLVYTNKIREKKVLLLSGRYIYENSDQFYRIDEFLYPELFPNLTASDNVEQSNTNRYQFAGFEAHFLERNKKGNLWEVQLGNAFRLDELNSEFV